MFTWIILLSYQTFVFTIGRPQTSWYKVYHILHIYFQTFMYDNLSITEWMIIYHYDDVTMSAVASQITSLTIVYSTVYSDPDQRKLQSSASLAFVRGIHRGPVNSPHKWPLKRKMSPFDDVIMSLSFLLWGRFCCYWPSSYWAYFAFSGGQELIYCYGTMPAHLSILLNTGRGKGTETCVLDTVLPLNIMHNDHSIIIICRNLVGS